MLNVNCSACPCNAESEQICISPTGSGRPCRNLFCPDGLRDLEAGADPIQDTAAVMNDLGPACSPSGSHVSGLGRLSTPARSISHQSTDSRVSLGPDSSSYLAAEQPATSGVGALSAQADRRCRALSPVVSASCSPREERRRTPSFWTGALGRRGLSVDGGRDLQQLQQQQQQQTPSKRLFGGANAKSPQQQTPERLQPQMVEPLKLPVGSLAASAADVTGVPLADSPKWAASSMPATIGRDGDRSPTSAALKAERHVRAMRIQHFWRKKSRSGQGAQLRSGRSTPSSESCASLTSPVDSRTFPGTPLGGRSPFAGAMSAAAIKIQSSWRKQRSKGSDGHKERRPFGDEPLVQQPKDFDSNAMMLLTETTPHKRGFWSDTQNWIERQARQTWKGISTKNGPGLLESWWKDRKKRAMESLLHNSAPVLKRTLGDLGDVLKENATADPDMWTWVRPLIRTIISSLWEDIEMEIEAGLKIAVLKKPELETEKERRSHDPALARGLRWMGLKIRAFVLSHYLPHNKSIFGRFKDPIYLLMVASTMLPVFGIRVFFFSAILVMLLFPGPPDEFQLINFILIFKGTQFFTTGVILGYFGAISYYACYLFGGDDLRECIDTQGPGAKDWLSSLLFDYVGSMCLVWIAFLALPLSKRHWHSHYVLGSSTPVEKPPEVYCFCLKGVPGRGGRLRRLLRYDLAMFLFSSLIFLPVYLAGEHNLEPSHRTFTRAKQTIFWCRILYSIFSLPFVIFVIPGLGRVLTHSVTTGYDSTGACLEFAFPTRFRYVEKSKAENRKAG
mmetsp:Transcript_44130/g.116758  ORF Transcript_44130/g.116758 Transcript_44130/m.116758 type:complete len:790 (+) Transcript_44130:117-2486(+)